MNEYDFIKVGAKVYYTDSDGILENGEYYVIKVQEEIEEDTPIWIGNEDGDLLAYPHELSEIK